MPSMTDPMDALKGFKAAFKTLKLQVAALDKDLFVHLDEPAPDVIRYTYARIIGNTVEAVALFVVGEPYEGAPCFQTGYAVDEPFRGQGKAKAILKASIEELKHGFARTQINEFWIEAVVGTDNFASQAVARAVISETAKSCTDEVSGHSALAYFRKIRAKSRKG